MAEAKKKQSNAVPAAPKEEMNPEARIKPTDLTQVSRAKPMSFRRSEVVEVRYTHYCEPGDDFDAVLKPDYWSHVADRITVMSHITVINKINGWEAELRVLQVANKLVKVVPLRMTQWEDVVTSADDINRLKSNYRVETRGDGWRVVDSDGNQLIAGLGSEKEAYSFIDQMLQNVAA